VEKQQQQIGKLHELRALQKVLGWVAAVQKWVHECGNSSLLHERTYGSAAYRLLKDAPQQTADSGKPLQTPSGLSKSERADLMTLLNPERFIDQTPPEVYGEPLSEGTYLASVSTRYRLLRADQKPQARRAQRVPARYHAPAVRVERPSQVWVWDITRVPGPVLAYGTTCTSFPTFTVAT
jgi:hypothetical protein